MRQEQCPDDVDARVGGSDVVDYLQVIGYDDQDHVIRRPHQSDNYTPARPGNNPVIQSNNQARPELQTIGLRKVPIREDFSKYPTTRKPQQQSNFIFSDYDDTDYNPRIKVNYYLNGILQSERKPSLPRRILPFEHVYDVENDVEEVVDTAAEITIEEDIRDIIFTTYDTMEEDNSTSTLTETTTSASTSSTKTTQARTTTQSTTVSTTTTASSSSTQSTITLKGVKCLLAIIRCCDEKSSELPHR